MIKVNNKEKLMTEIMKVQSQMKRFERSQKVVGKKKLSKKKAGMMTLLAMVLLISGTYAWNNFNQRALNPLSEITNHGGRIHNNYHIAETEIASGEHIKRIFGENFGSSQLFVRIRLREFLAVEEVTLGSGPNGVTPVVDNPETWMIYTAEGSDVHDRSGESALIGERGIGLNFGEDIEDTRTLYMPTFNRTSQLPDDVEIGIPVPFDSVNAFQMTEIKV